MDIKINGLQHVGIPVTDLQRSVVFYQQLGFATVMAEDFVYDGGDGKAVMMKGSAVILELYQMPEKQLAEIRTRKDGHVDHIAFDVDDIDKTFAMVKAGEFTVLEKEPVFLAFWKNGCRYFNILGPDGERLEFNQIL